MTRLITELPNAPAFPVDVALTCEGCGCLFGTWDGYEDQEKCAGFGVSARCQTVARWVTRNGTPPHFEITNGAVWGCKRTDAPVDALTALPIVGQLNTGETDHE